MKLVSTEALLSTILFLNLIAESSIYKKIIEMFAYIPQNSTSEIYQKKVSSLRNEQKKGAIWSKLKAELGPGFLALVPYEAQEYNVFNSNIEKMGVNELAIFTKEIKNRKGEWITAIGKDLGEYFEKELNNPPLFLESPNLSEADIYNHGDCSPELQRLFEPLKDSPIQEIPSGSGEPSPAIGNKPPIYIPNPSRMQRPRWNSTVKQIFPTYPPRAKRIRVT